MTLQILSVDNIFWTSLLPNLRYSLSNGGKHASEATKQCAQDGGEVGRCTKQNVGAVRDVTARISSRELVPVASGRGRARLPAPASLRGK